MRQSGLFCGLVKPTEAERMLNGFRLKTAHRLDWRTQYQQALEAFASYGYLVLINDHQVDDLDALVELHAGTEVTFFKLVPLVGG